MAVWAGAGGATFQARSPRPRSVNHGVSGGSAGPLRLCGASVGASCSFPRLTARGEGERGERRSVPRVTSWRPCPFLTGQATPGRIGHSSAPAGPRSDPQSLPSRRRGRRRRSTFTRGDEGARGGPLATSPIEPPAAAGACIAAQDVPPKHTPTPVSRPHGSMHAAPRTCGSKASTRIYKSSSGR